MRINVWGCCGIVVTVGKVGKFPSRLWEMVYLFTFFSALVTFGAVTKLKTSKKASGNDKKILFAEIEGQI